MGHIEVEVGIGDLDGEKLIRVKALVDTGATFTIIPESIVKNLNLTLTGEKVRVSTAKGYGELDLTHAILEIDGRGGIMSVLVSRDIDRVLGVITLEAM
jgi:predicted aspartyl protease